MSTTFVDPSKLHNGTVSLPDERTCEGDPRPVDILIVDDNRLASYSLWALLNWQPGIRIRATAESRTEALALIQRLRPDLCLLSASFDACQGIRLAYELKQMAAPPRVLVYADRLDTRLAGAAAIAGADGVIWRYADPDELAQLIERVVAPEPRRPPVGPEAILVGDSTRPVRVAVQPPLPDQRQR
jgi:DNA-binding NarL/FixJ family response regulator